MDVRDKSKISTISGFMEERHASNQAKERGFMVRVRNANRNQKDTRRHAGEMDPKLFRPQRMRVLVNDIPHETPRRTREHIEQPKHSCPPPAARLLKIREILKVVRSEDRVDGQFAAEGTEVCHRENKGLEGKDNAA